MTLQPAGAGSVPADTGRPVGRDAVYAAPHGAGHTVQFYEDEAFLSSAVATFLGAGLTAGQPLIVIATEPHRAAFEARLAADGFDVRHPDHRGGVTWLDAHETLDRFMAGPMPNRQRFRAAIAPVIEQSRNGSRRQLVRMYGEMVDVLWAAGNTDGAIRLEELWNELGRDYEFSLLCAYAMGHFYKEGHTEQFRAICAQHGHVIPTERYSQIDDETRLVEISILQQRARALEAEIGHRKELERRLRDALRERHAAEEALRATARELKAALTEREQALQREQAARAEAEAANRAKSEFLAVMSHELRTPLNAIGGYVQLIEMEVHGPVNEVQRDALARVQRSQRHLLALINDVLNLVRIETGHIEYALEEVPLGPLLSDVTSMVEPLVRASDLACDVILPPDGAADSAIAVRADREKVRQIVINLLTNATKFTPAGGRVSVEVEPAPGTPAMVHVHLRDTGIGIPAAKLETIFEPFVQIDAHSTTQRDGVGLGLAISRDLARGMGGDLTVRSTVGEGTTFTLTLPRA